MSDSSKTPVQTSVSPWLRRVAVCLACATFPLIFVGGLVTTTKSGMAVPDWPSTYGYNLFLYPWETWVFGPWKLFVEHGHRLFGSLVGMLAIAQLAIAWRTKASRSFVIGAAISLLLVCFQGFLGGARVLLESRGILDGRAIALLHGCMGPAFFTYCVLYAAATSQRSLPPLAASSRLASAQVGSFSLFLALLAFIQLVLGANLRHVPDTAQPSFFKMVTLMHLAVAAALLVQSLLLAWRIWGLAELRRRFGGSASGLLVLLVTQIGLGVTTWVLKYGYPPTLPFADHFARLTLEHQSLLQVLTVTAHVANGSLILALAARLAFVSRSYRSFAAPVITAPLAAAAIAEGLA